MRVIWDILWIDSNWS